MFESIQPAPTTMLSDELARQYAPRIRRHAARYARRLPRHVPVSDLVSAGYEGLVDAFVRFDTTRTDSLEAYIDHRIRGAILDELREHDPLTRDQRTFARKMASVTQQLSTALGRTPDASELAAGLGIPLAQLHAQVSRMNNTAAQNTPTLYDEDVADAADAVWVRPDEAVEMRERRVRVNEAIEQLPARQRDVLRMHYEQGLTMRQVAEALGVTESRVSQIHSETITRLRKLVADA
jgi:RNA polymerase sigma factor for flagellar operon FliA